MKLLEVPSDVKLLAIDIETTGLERTDEIISSAVAWLNNHGSIASNFYLLDRFNGVEAPDEQAFKSILERTLWNPDNGITVIFHNISFDFVRLFLRFRPNMQFNSRNCCRMVDTAVISRTLKNNKFTSHIDPAKTKAHSLKYLAREHLGIQHRTFEDVVGRRNIRFTDKSDLASYNKSDSELTLKLYLHFKQICPPSVWKHYEEIEYEQTINLLHLDLNGVPFDVKAAHDLLATISVTQERLSREIFGATGGAFNLASGDELSRAIFNNRRFTYGDGQVVKPLYKTEKGRTKTDLETLTDLKLLLKDAPSAKNVIFTLNKIMQYEELVKVASKVEGTLRYVVETRTGPRIFPNFNANAKSGRATTSRPNLLGLPKRIFKKSEVTDDIPTAR